MYGATFANLYLYGPLFQAGSLFSPCPILSVDTSTVEPSYNE